ncbi:MAG: amino acid permease, partial [Anaerolineae bacterium]|nr:amino acid permease [Anaerolineae bacterium]
LFTAINYRGASETGTIGNVVTMAKICILGLFVLFGLIAMARTEGWQARFTESFMPNGILGVFVAMGLTFVAFEGYEIIAQSGEEVIAPKRNIPRATFYSIFIAVTIYILVGITAIGATVPPPGMKVWEYLGLQKEVAIVEVARQTFPLGLGAVVLLLSGLVSTMSALNATTYSASRVSFAMGRDHNLPAFFAEIHPQRHTPHWAVVCSGALMILTAWLLPIEKAAAASGIMFLLLFLQVNLTVLYLRRRMPDLERGFKIPGFPATPLVAILCNGLLAAYLYTYSPIAWYFAAGWIVLGLLAYYMYFSKIEEMEKPKEILLEEVLVSRDYSVLVPVSNTQQARILGQIGAILAQDHGGEVLALHVVRVPPQLTLGEGRIFLKEGRQYLETVIEQAKARDVPVHTMIRLARDVAEGIRKTALENASDLLLLGWPGYTQSSGRIYGRVIDALVDDPPVDTVVVRYRARRPVRSILVPVAGGPNSRRCVRLAVSMARHGEEGPARLTILHVVPAGSTEREMVRAEQALRYSTADIDYPHMEHKIVPAANVVAAILAEAQGHDLIVIGATEEPLFKNLLIGNIADRVAQRAPVTVMIVKRRSGPLHSFLRQTLLEPSSAKAAEK